MTVSMAIISPNNNPLPYPPILTCQKLPQRSPRPTTYSIVPNLALKSPLREKGSQWRWTINHFFVEMHATQEPASPLHFFCSFRLHSHRWSMSKMTCVALSWERGRVWKKDVTVVRGSPIKSNLNGVSFPVTFVNLGLLLFHLFATEKKGPNKAGSLFFSSSTLSGLDLQWHIKGILCLRPAMRF
jgi:hypothetical protein